MKKGMICLLVLVVAGCLMIHAFIGKEEESDQSLIVQPPRIENRKMEQTKTNTLEYLIETYLMEEQIDRSKIAIYIHSFMTDEEYTLNANVDFTAASLYKLPLAMLYYDRIQTGQYQLETPFWYEPIHYEAGGPIGDTYHVYSWIPLSTLLHNMIVHSDNTAGHILYENLGGWLAYRENCANSYIASIIKDSFFTYDNIITAQYMNEFLQYLYEHRNAYVSLIDDLYEATPHQYLNLYMPNSTAQKYGWYNNALNAAGIVFAQHAYSIVILTDMGESAERYIGEINQLCYEYFNYDY